MLYRMRIGLAAAAVLLVLTFVVQSVVTRDLEGSITHRVELDVARAQRVFDQMARLDGSNFASLASALASRTSVVAVFDKSGNDRQQSAFDECEAINGQLGKESRKADILGLLDGAGRVVARDLNPNANVGDDLKAKYPAVGLALRGQAVKDIWNFSGRMMRVSLAPVRKADGSVVGALLVGYVLTATEAQAKRDVAGADVAFFHEGKVHTSSFVAEGDKEDGNRTQKLDGVLFQSADKPGAAALQKKAATEVFRFKMEGQEYAAVAAPMPGNAFDQSSGVAVVKSISEEIKSASAVGMKILLFGLLAILVAVGAAVLTAVRFVKPLDQIELGVSEIINGNIEYQFRPVGPDFEGLENALNVMLARLLGRDEPDENAVEDDEGGPPKWRSDQIVVEEAAPAGAQPSNDPAIAALAQESEASYFPRLFGEYTAALKQAGRPSEGITVQAFTAKLRLTEGGLKQKWKCRMVRFRVAHEGGQVILKPVPIF